MEMSLVGTCELVAQCQEYFIFVLHRSYTTFMSKFIFRRWEKYHVHGGHVFRRKVVGQLHSLAPSALMAGDLAARLSSNADRQAGAVSASRGHQPDEARCSTLVAAGARGRVVAKTLVSVGHASVVRVKDDH
jgi:hypothetical protein